MVFTNTQNFIYFGDVYYYQRDELNTALKDVSMKKSKRSKTRNNDFRTQSTIASCWDGLVSYALSVILVHLVAQSIDISVNVWIVVH